MHTLNTSYMWLRIIVIVFLPGCFNPAQAQTLNDRLLELEYRIYHETNDTNIAALLLEKSDLCLDSGKYTRAVNEFHRMDLSVVPRKEQPRFLHNAALASYLVQDYYYTLFYLKELERLPEKDSASFILLKGLAYSQYDTLKCREFIAIHPELQPLQCVIATAAYTPHGRGWKIASSAIVPGSGMIANGNVLKGGTAMLIAAGSVLGLRWIAMHQLYLNLIGWGTNAGLKFYIGNLRLTGKLADEKAVRTRAALAFECETALFALLQKYPLRFQTHTTQPSVSE